MKYGDTLQQRSIPFWETYNIDYNDIKHLIKVRTTHGQAQAKAIPGSNNEAKHLQDFEEELYQVLCEQHQRIDLFVQSKSGEIARRLTHLDKQIAHLEIRTSSHGQSKIPIRRLEKFSRAEAATLNAGEEIQSLSRFVGAQRLAFQKLLKKYSRWTGSPSLGTRFREEILDRPTSFSKRGFEELLAQWTEVLASVRAPFENGTTWHPDPPKVRAITSSGITPPVTQHSADHAASQAQDSADMHSRWEEASNIEIDTAFAGLPSGGKAARAVYWVHPDNIVQVHVLLLQFFRLHRSNEVASSPRTPSSSWSSPDRCANAQKKKITMRTDEEFGVVFCDDFQRLARRCENDRSYDSEDDPGVLTDKAAAVIRYCSNGDAIVAIGAAREKDRKSAKPNKDQPLHKVKFGRKVMHRLFATCSSGEGRREDTSNDFEQARRWLNAHREIQPLIRLESKRTRFEGLKNSRASGIWATLDTKIAMRRCSRELFARGESLVASNKDGELEWKAFPHAVLEVRTGGDASGDIIEMLDASYLTERIRGFSLEVHAVAMLYKEHGLSRPFWLPALEQEIRKVPPTTNVSKGRAMQGCVSPEEPSTRATSVSAESTTNGPSNSGFSISNGESSATSAPDAAALANTKSPEKKRRQSHRRRMLDKRLRHGISQTKRQRYWNEFDNGSEGSETEAYTIYVNPEASYDLPGAAALSKLATSFGSMFTIAHQLLTSPLKTLKKAQDNEHAPLLNDALSPSPDDSDLSDSESCSARLKPGNKRRYSTFPAPPQPPAVRARESLLLRSCMASFAASFVLLIVAAILKTTGRRKAETTVDAGVIIGVAASIVFAIIGVGSMVGRRDKLGWAHRSIVFSIFVLVVIGSGSLTATLRHAASR